MDKNEFYIVKEYKFDISLITKVDSILDSCYKYCYKN